jgi:hypothetical protein
VHFTFFKNYLTLTDDRKHTFNLGKIFFAASNCEYGEGKILQENACNPHLKMSKIFKKNLLIKKFQSREKIKVERPQKCC